MSPKEFHALHKCYKEHMEHLDWQMAGLKSFYAHCNGQKISAEEFMGKKAKNKPYPSNEQLENDLESLFGCGPKKAAKEAEKE